MKNFCLILNLFLLITLANGCSYKSDKSAAASGSVRNSGLKIDKSFLTFANIKEQVLAPKCLKCHKGYVDYANVTEVKNEIFQRALVQKDMPKNTSGLSLTDNEQNLLQQWIELGAPLDEVTSVDNPAVNPTPVIIDPNQNTLGIERPVLWATVKLKIFDKHCLSCHFKGNADGISEYEDLKTIRNTIGTIYGLTAIKPFMPPPATELNEGEINPNQLSTAEKDLLSAWINDGMLETK
jgi:hypothetical protein